MEKLNEEVKRVLLTADVHIASYANEYNFGSGFRLGQFEKVARRLVQIALNENVDRIIIAGDLINTPVLNTEESHALNTFSGILNQWARLTGGEILITLGQHDLASKEMYADKEKSVVTLIPDHFEHIYYVDRQIEKYSGKVFAFQNWQPNHDLKWLGELRPDVLINHFTLMAGGNFVGQTIDSTKFGIQFSGDIHNRSEVGNIVSICNPICHRMGDEVNGSVVILEIDPTPEFINGVMDITEVIDHVNGDTNWRFENGVGWKRVGFQKAGEYEFLRVYRTKNAPKNAGELSYDVEIPNSSIDNLMQKSVIDINEKGEEVELTPEQFKVKLINSIKVDEVLATSVKRRELDEEHLSIEGMMAQDGIVSHDSSIDISFDPEEIIIQNFRSIKQLTYQFRDGTTLIKGRAGAGKSSILMALEYALFGSSSAKSKVRNESNGKMTVDLTFKYNGQHFRIFRGWHGGGVLKFWKGSNEDILNSFNSDDDESYYGHVESNNMRDLSKMIESHLPFLEVYHKVLYISQSTYGIMSGMSQSERTKLLSQILGWEKLGSYAEYSKAYLKDRTKISEGYKVALEARDLTISEMSEMMDGKTVESVRGKVKSTRDRESEIQKSIFEFEEYSWYCQEVEERNRTLEINSTKLDTLRENSETDIAPINPSNIFSPEDLKESSENLKNLKGKETEQQRLIESRKVKVEEILKLASEVEGFGNVNMEALLKEKDDNRISLELIKKLHQLDSNYTSKVGLSEDRVKELEDQIVSIRETERCSNCYHLETSSEEKVNSIKLLIQSELENLGNFKDKKDEAVSLTVDIFGEYFPMDSYEYSNRLHSSMSKDAEIDSRIKETAERLLKIDKLKGYSDGFNSLGYRLNREELSKYIESLEVGLEELRIITAEQAYQIENHITWRKSYTDFKSWESSISALSETVKEGEKFKMDNPISEWDMKDRKDYNSKMLEELGGVRAELENLKSEISNVRKFEDLSNGRVEIKLNYDEAMKKLERANEYFRLVGEGGEIMQSILETSSRILSSDLVNVKTTRELGSGELKPDLSLELKVKGKWIPYSELSGGQLGLVDLMFVLSLIEASGGTGMLIMDEATKHFDQSMTDEIAGLLSKSTVRSKTMTMHNQSYPYSDRVIQVELGEDGISNYS